MKRLIPIALSSLLLVSCGSGGSSDTVAFSNLPTGIPYNTSAAKTTAFAAGDADCPTGGILVETGVDKNGNGILEDSEVSKTQKVCNGAVGATGPAGSGNTNLDVATVKALLVGTWNFLSYSRNVDYSFKAGYGTIVFQSNGTVSFTDESNILSTGVWTIENNTILKITDSNKTSPLYIQRVSANQIDLTALDGFVVMKK